MRFWYIDNWGGETDIYRFWILTMLKRACPFKADFSYLGPSEILAFQEITGQVFSLSRLEEIHQKIFTTTGL